MALAHVIQPEADFAFLLVAELRVELLRVLDVCRIDEVQVLVLAINARGSMNHQRSKLLLVSAAPL